MSWRKTYAGYNIGCAAAWAVLLVLIAVAYPDCLHTFLLVVGGWLIG